MGIRVRLARLAAASAALVLLGAGCASDGSGESDGGSAESDGSAEEESFTVVAHQGEDLLGGSEVEFGSLLGNGTPVVLNFWAAQCPPCRAEMPWFQAAYEEHSDSVLLVGLDVGQFTGLGTTEQGAQLLDELDITYPAGYAVDEEPLRRFEVTNMPSTVFFDGAGEVVDAHAGVLTEQQIRDRFASLAADAQ
ncbi:MAG: TlpA family protein disulfide reductase [Actinomycetota bacterium]